MSALDDILQKCSQDRDPIERCIVNVLAQSGRPDLVNDAADKYAALCDENEKLRAKVEAGDKLAEWAENAAELIKVKSEHHFAFALRGRNLVEAFRKVGEG